MSANWYSRMMRTLCEQINISDWAAVLASQQIEVNGFNVALYPDQDASTSLAMYVELAKYDANPQSDMLLCLLESNAATSGAVGFFGVVPDHGIIVYRTTIQNAKFIQCDELLLRMMDLVSSGTAQFHQIMSRHLGSMRATQQKSQAKHRQRRGVW